MESRYIGSRYFSENPQSRYIGFKVLKGLKEPAIKIQQYYNLVFIVLAIYKRG